MAKANTLQSRLEGKPIKVNKWNAQEVKVAFDDAIVKYMTEEASFAHDQTSINMRLACSIVINIIGGATALYSYLTPIRRGWMLTGLGAGTYLFVLGCFNLYMSFLAPTYFFKGEKINAKDSSRKLPVVLSSRVILPDAIYVLNTRHGNDVRVGFGEWIAEDGFIDSRAFCSDMDRILSLHILPHQS